MQGLFYKDLGTPTQLYRYQFKTVEGKKSHHSLLRQGKASFRETYFDIRQDTVIIESAEIT